VAAVVVLLVADAGSEVFDDIGGSVLVLVYVAWIAGIIGATCGSLAGAAGGAVLGCLAEIGMGRRPLLLSGAVVGAALGWFALDLATAIGSAPDDDTIGELLLWRAGPVGAGAAAATWHATRTRLRPPAARGGRSASV
jgi:hypothetical protein